MLDNTLDVLRADPFVVTLILIIHFFQDRPGLTLRQEIYEERLKYLKLLDIYFKGMLKSGIWKSVSYTQVWDNFNFIIGFLPEMHRVCSEIVRKNPM